MEVITENYADFVESVLRAHESQNVSVKLVTEGIDLSSLIQLGIDRNGESIRIIDKASGTYEIVLDFSRFHTIEVSYFEENVALIRIDTNEVTYIQIVFEI